MTDKINNNQTSENDEINLNFIFNTLFREKKFILIVVFLSTLSSIIFSFIVKPIWKGSFNIVVKEDESQSNILGKGASDLLGIDLGVSEGNKTQILILKSPSVLMPVYEYVKDEYEKKGIKTNSMDFKEWLKGDLLIEFQKKTSVLNVEYKNKDRELIINTLNLIAKKYKDYSKIKTEKDITRTINYLESQTKLTKEKYLKSTKEFNSFSIENGLGNIDGFIGLGKSTNSNISSNTNNPLLKNITGGEDNQLLKKLISNGQFKNIQDFTGKESLAGQRYSAQFLNLERYEAAYVDLSSKLKPNSSTLTQLKLKIDNLRSSLKRPNEILLRYKQLKNTATKNERILKELENNLALMKLQRIKTPNPWEMISVPTIDERPLFPVKRRIVGLTFFLSLVLGSSLALLKERKSGYLFEFDAFLTRVPFKFIENLYFGNPTLNTKLVSKNVEKFNKNRVINFINLSDNFFINENSNKSIFSDELEEYKFLNCENIYSSKDLKNIVLIAEPGKINEKNLNIILSYLSIYNDQVLGWFFLK